MSKTIICRCEDVTLLEIEEAIAHGKTDIESIKRYLSLGTGPCQSKNCMAILTKILVEKGLLNESDAQPITSRPPVHMTPLKYFAGQESEDE